MGYANVRHHNNQGVAQTVMNPTTSRTSKTFPTFVSPMQGESLVLVAHPSAMNYLWVIVLGVLLIPVIFIGVVMLLYAYINIKTTCFVITNKRVITKTGLLRISQSEVRIDDVRGVNLQRDLWQRIIGTGNVTIGTAATGGAEIVMSGVGNPNHVVEAVNSQRKN